MLSNLRRKACNKHLTAPRVRTAREDQWSSDCFVRFLEGIIDRAPSRAARSRSERGTGRGESIGIILI